MVLKEAEEKRLIGMKLSRTGTEITHLFFADDSLFFLKGNERNCDKLSEIRKKYCIASGQAVNLSKSSLIFGTNTPDNVKSRISNRFGMLIAWNPGTYLALNLGTRKEALHFVKERIFSRIQGWKQKMLLKGRREVLLKAVACAIPTYFMSCFQFPVSLCKEINSGMARFWWGQQKEEFIGRVGENSQKLKLRVVWGQLEFFNQALLAKQYWRLTQNPNALWAKVLKGISFPNCDITEARRGGRASWMWSSILEGRDFIDKEEGCWNLGGAREMRHARDR